MNVFISGGAKNGKSSFAQRLAVNMAKEKNCPLYYVATMVPHDGEDRARIERHRDDRRGLGFKTIECGRDIDVEIRNRGDGVFLIDSVTALLSNEMFRADGTVDGEASIRISERLKALVKDKDGLIFVSDFIYADGVEYDEITDGYIRGLAIIDRALAKTCDRVVEMINGIPIDYKDDRAIQEDWGIKVDKE
jgi:adenosylcobinamide kinase/adenosylcobinamide-phosphate guanylyltransferase